MERNRICDLIGIRYPIFQGGMAWVSTAELACAVSNAGGLGIIAAGQAPADWVEEQVLKAQKLTDKPFGVNVMLLSPYADEIIRLLAHYHVPVATTGAGNPGKHIGVLKEAGTRFIPVVPSVALAKRMEKEGADAVIAEGTESGGHIGELTTMALVPQVVDAVSIPVIAAGGIADGRGIAAAFALGAQGVQLGTRFICSEECTAHDNYKQAVIAAKDRDAIVCGRKTGHPVRCLKNKLTKRFLDSEYDGTPVEEVEKIGEGKLRAAVVDGDMATGSVMSGQIAGMVHDIKPCKEIIAELVSGFEAACKGLGGTKL